MTDAAGAPVPAAISPLAAFALKGLGHCWMPEHGLFSHRHRLDGSDPANESVPASDPFYSLTALLGMSRLPGQGRHTDFSVAEIFNTAADALMRKGVPRYAFGMCLWASGELGIEIPDRTSREILRLLENDAACQTFTAQDLGTLISGCVARARREGQPWDSHARRLCRLLFERFDCPESPLFYNNASGPRRGFVSFAGCVHLMLALYQFGEWAGDEQAIGRANACAAHLIARQGPQGEWPWFFHAPSGHVVDFYEVFSVHQDSMAPAFLRHSATHGVAGADDALVRGFNWVLGDNQLGCSMLADKVGLIYRSQLRAGQEHGRARRALRAVANGLLGREDSLLPNEMIAIRRECRSYHLGWILWSFVGQDGYRALTHHPAFADAL